MKIKLYTILSLFFLTSSTIKTEKMKLYAIYTPSHTVLKDHWFLPSIQDDFDLIFEFHEQTCPSANFMRQGWTKTTIKKVELIVRAIQENWGKIFIFSDVDIQFFGPIQNHIMRLMANRDMIIQKNTPKGTLCSGFFACRGNKKTLQLWQDVLNLMQNNIKISDQVALNRCLRKGKKKNKENKYGIIWSYLPSTFLACGALTGYGWSSKRKFPVPHDIIMHHANWTLGIKNKIEQLTYVRNVIQSRRN